MKQRFEVYVCTAAERGYALEAWRILDPQVWATALQLHPSKMGTFSMLSSCRTAEMACAQMSVGSDDSGPPTNATAGGADQPRTSAAAHRVW